jgi:hypothetical protein
MTGFTLAAAASIAAGLSIGAAATVGVTLALDHGTPPAYAVSPQSGPHLVQYGDRCYQGHCLPCNNPRDCLNKVPLPPWLRP